MSAVSPASCLPPAPPPPQPELSCKILIIVSWSLPDPNSNIWIKATLLDLDHTKSPKIYQIAWSWDLVGIGDDSYAVPRTASQPK